MTFVIFGVVIIISGGGGNDGRVKSHTTIVVYASMPPRNSHQAGADAKAVGMPPC